jgi:hypothetical protein
MEQELLTIQKHLIMSSPQAFSGVRVTRSLVLRVCYIDRCLSFYPFSFGHCVVSFLDLRLLITPLVSSNSSYQFNVMNIQMFLHLYSNKTSCFFEDKVWTVLGMIVWITNIELTVFLFLSLLQSEQSIITLLQSEQSIITWLQSEQSIITLLQSEQSIITLLQSEQSIITLLQSEQSIITLLQSEQSIITLLRVFSVHC